jgi:hypothetical protein
MDAALMLPLSQRINLRVLTFVAVLLFLLGWPVYTFLSETLTGGIHDRGGYKDVELKALGFFNFDPYEGALRDVPARYRALDGQKVRLTGLVVPRDEANEEITEFTLQYSTVSCCVGNSLPLVQEKVYARAVLGRSLHMTRASYYHVFGTLHVTIKRAPGNGLVEQVYQLDAESMTPL